MKLFVIILVILNILISIYIVINFNNKLSIIEYQTRTVSDAFTDNIEYNINKDKCYSEVATAKKDVEICNNVEDENLKDYCYGDVARVTQDKTICSKPVNPVNKERCLRASLASPWPAAPSLSSRSA